jgi:hypothetical protein
MVLPVAVDGPYFFFVAFLTAFFAAGFFAAAFLVAMVSILPFAATHMLQLPNV